MKGSASILTHVLRDLMHPTAISGNNKKQNVVNMSDSAFYKWLRKLIAIKVIGPIVITVFIGSAFLALFSKYSSSFKKIEVHTSDGASFTLEGKDNPEGQKKDNNPQIENTNSQDSNDKKDSVVKLDNPVSIEPVKSKCFIDNEPPNTTINPDCLIVKSVFIVPVSQANKNIKVSYRLLLNGKPVTSYVSNNIYLLAESVLVKDRIAFCPGEEMDRNKQFEIECRLQDGKTFESLRVAIK